MLSWISVKLYILIYPSYCPSNFLTSMYMYLDLMSDMELSTCSLIVVKSDVGVLNPPV